MPFAIAFGIGLLLVPAARRIGLAAGLVDRPGDPLRVHTQPVSYVGGVAVTLSTVTGVLAWGESLATPVLAAVALALIVGYVDDRRTLPPALRLVTLLAAGAVLALGGLEVEPLGPAAGASTMLLVAACANAVNMMDGQDGLAGGLGAIAALAVAPIAGGMGSALGLALAGSLGAFLIWNRPPARIFLGNGGAYAVGTILAVLAAQAATTEGWPGLVAAGSALGVFAFELVFTIIRRLLLRRPLIPGDRLHSYDLTSTALGSRPRSTLLFWGIGGASGGVGLLIWTLPRAAGIGVAVAAAVGAVAAGLALWSRLRAETS